MSSIPATPTRRSKRYQPLVTYLPPTAWYDATTFWTHSEPCYTRPSVPEDYEALREENSSWEPKEGLLTRFYESFTRVVSGKPGSSSLLGRKKPRSSTRGKPSRGASEKEVYHVGDTVCIRTGLMSKGLSVGVIVAMWDLKVMNGRSREEENDKDNEEVSQDDGDEGGDMDARNFFIRIHWFQKPSELPNVRAKRDHYENEVYYTINAQAVLPPSSVVCLCTVTTTPPPSSLTTPRTLQSRHSHALVGIDQEDTTFYCRSAIDSRKGIYYEFDWEERRSLAISLPVEEQVSGKHWFVSIEVPSGRRTRPARTQPQQRQQKRAPPQTQSDVGSEYQGSSVGRGDAKDEDIFSVAGVESEDDIVVVISDSDVDDAPRTPRKRRRTTALSPLKSPRTPRKMARSVQLAAPTPHSKAALRARARSRKTFAVRLPLPDSTQEYDRELEKLPSDPWLRAMHVLHVAARPDILPCRDEEFSRVLRTVDELLEEGGGGCVYISGVPGTGKTATVHAVVRELKRMAENNETNPFSYVEINGLKIPEPSAAYNLLWEVVSGHNLAEDGHLRVSAREALRQLNRHFTAGARAGPGGHACIVLMDELDQLVTTKQDVVYNFFNWPTLVGSKLVVIAVANTMDLPERVMTGRVRSRLGMIRINFQPYTTPQLIEIVRARLDTATNSLPSAHTHPPALSPDAIKLACMKVASISGDARRVLDVCRRAVELAYAEERCGEARDVQSALAALQRSPTAAFLGTCSLHERIMLAALIRCVKREGVEEVRWGEIQTQHLTYTPVLGEGESTRVPHPDQLTIVLGSLLASRAILMEDGQAAARKPIGERRVVLDLEQTEVERVLGEIGGQAWRQALGVGT
ncbi:P-loop containing nucleoside triphosphate hydrolase protein [Pisolithus croceorrhizus]|nr:P-loop containing nucleoside triphosphate hydrolase protein [Pisolithus croceorrhizus]